MGSYNYGPVQGSTTESMKPSAAAQAIYSLPPAQQEKLSQIISQVRNAGLSLLKNHDIALKALKDNMRARRLSQCFGDYQE